MTTDSPQPPFASLTLPYYGRSGPVRKFRWWRGLWIVDALRVPRDSQARAGWWRRMAYYAATFALFLAIAFYVGPNEFLFRRVVYPYHSLADYVPEIENECVPMVRAIKAFQRDYGRMPSDPYEVIPGYLPSANLPCTMDGNEVYFLKGDHLISYDFAAGVEGWTASQGRVNGKVPAPLVTLGPSTRPASAPTP